VAEASLRTVTGAAAAAPITHAELHDRFVRLTRDEIIEQLADLAAAVRGGNFPAGRPYRHVNGFTKTVAAEYPCGARLTVHYWPAEPGTKDDESRPHDHRYPFSSILLGGAQRFVELQEEMHPEPGAGVWRRFAYRPYLSGRIATVVGAGTFALRAFQEVDRQPLDGHYTTSSSVVHQAVTSRRTACATLVLRGPRERRTSHVYYRPGEPAPRGGIQLGRWLPRDEVTRQLDDVIAMVTAAR
jgi:hypothetical protein